MGKIISFEAAASNGYDGIIRLLTDAERFGFGLKELRLSWPDGEVATIQIALAVAEGIQQAALAERFSRHPGLAVVRPLSHSDAWLQPDMASA